MPPMPELPEDPAERFEFALTKELEADIREEMEDNSTIAKAIYFGFETLKGQTIDKVTVDDITAEIKPKQKMRVGSDSR
jgi:hypothetical protein